MRISSKLSLRFVLLFAVFTIIAFFLFSYLVREKSEYDYIYFLSTLNNTISSTLVENDSLKKNYNEILNKIHSQFSNKPIIRITLISCSGKVIFESDTFAHKMDNHKTRPEIMKALNGEVGTSIRQSKTLKKDFLFVASPVKNSDKTQVISIIRTSVLVKDFDSQTAKFAITIIFFLVIFLLFGFLILDRFSKRITVPICEIENATKEFASGNLDVTVKAEGKDEIASLANNFNIMIDNFKKLLSELKYLEQVKRDFIVNVSHELKTPLTAIKGFIETLEDELIEDEIIEEKELKNYLKYIDITKRHTHRLISIVQDLLMLSETETVSSSLMKSKTDVKMLLEKMLPIFSQKLEEKQLKLITEFTPDFPEISVDAFKFEQIFVNLIDNAIKYSDKGEIKIAAKADNEYAYFTVTDSGIGIKPEDQTRIFERFYTANKSRSRQTGGTGLGLSIVKHIVLLHKGEITVESKLGTGTVFLIKLPIV